MKRNLQLDTVKGILIILVVLGHVIGNVGNIRANVFCSKVYDFIYMFHMPLFVFISGYFTRKKDTMRGLWMALAAILLPFIIFHSMHAVAPLINGVPYSIKYVIVPGWSMWFLLSLVYWRVLIQFAHSFLHRFPVVAFILSVAISAFCGILPGGHEFSIQRTMHFLPFFLLGYYVGQGVFPQIRLGKIWSVTILVAVICLVAFNLLPEDYRALIYGANAYGLDRILAKVFLLICSFALSISILNLCKENNTLADVGKESMTYYLWHTIMIALVIDPSVKSLNLPDDNIIHSIIYTSIIMLSLNLLSRLKPVRFLVKPLG